MMGGDLHWILWDDAISRDDQSRDDPITPSIPCNLACFTKILKAEQQHEQLDKTEKQ